ncbi:hypothetical protein N1851_015160 [Merluccius polli]|uniref:Uncharacterized protein n=1 Tax=Merluccius polli TaxID=89951 RepID=A0AA47MTR6_MERPO|nr:hypothetical protein N1851_015160 [Merluccius polli]
MEFHTSRPLNSSLLDTRPKPDGTRGDPTGPDGPAKTLRLDRLLIGTDPLALPEDILYERYRFSSEDIPVLVGPYVGNATKRSHAQCVCVSLRFVATGTYLHTVGDAENISKKVPCDTQGCSCPKYTAKWCLPTFCQRKLSSCKLSTCR